MDRLDSVLPGDSASHNGVPDTDEHSALEYASPSEAAPFTFKFKAPGGRVHRLQVVAASGLADLVAAVAEKLGHEAEALGGTPTFEEGSLSHTGFALSYLDNEGDTVSLTTDADLLEAIALARQARKDKVDLFVHHPERPAIPITLDPQPASVSIPPTPPESQIRPRKVYAPAEEDEEGGEEEEEEEEEDGEQGVVSHVTERRRERKSATSPKTGQQEQILPGVPNEMLLPGALVVLGVVVVVTFAIGRASSR